MLKTVAHQNPITPSGEVAERRVSMDEPMAEEETELANYLKYMRAQNAIKKQQQAQ